MRTFFISVLFLLCFVSLANAKNSLIYLGVEKTGQRSNANATWSIFNVIFAYDLDEAGAKVSLWWCDKDGNTTKLQNAKYVQKGNGKLIFNDVKIVHSIFPCMDLRGHLQSGNFKDGVSIWTAPIRICYKNYKTMQETSDYSKLNRAIASSLSGSSSSSSKSTKSKSYKSSSQKIFAAIGIGSILGGLLIFTADRKNNFKLGLGIALVGGTIGFLGSDSCW